MNDGISLGSYQLSRKVLLSICVAALLSVNFILGYIVHNFYSQGILDVTNPGFWLGILNFSVITGMVLFYKRVDNLSWSDLGLGRPDSWWKPLLVAAGTYGAIMLFSKFLMPSIMELGPPPNSSHLFVINQNLPMLIFTLVVVWITAAFLEELIFRAFLINSLDFLFGSSKWSLAAAVLLSSVIFGLCHAYQGFTGILITGSLGLIFGIAYALNSRRIWPLIFVHGIVDTIALIGIYNM